MEEEIRVLRVIEYVGPRSRVEDTIRRSIHGDKTFGFVTIRAATIGMFPEILSSLEEEKDTP